MKIVFMGTPGFAVPSLKILYESNHKIEAVVTGEDKERGRGRKITYTPVKEFALQNNLQVLQPVNLRDHEFISGLKNFNADIFVVVAFRILPVEVFTIPRKGSFNLHASLLPKYRGAAPIQWALINGEKETGVTTFALEEKVDTGNIYLKEKISIEEDDDYGSLYNKLSELGSEAVLKTVHMIESGNFELEQQDNNLATPAPKITKETGNIDWTKSAAEIHNLIRGLSPHPGAYFYNNDKLIKVFKSKVISEWNLNPGEIKTTKSSLIIGCGKNALELLELQLEGRKKLNAEEFLRGYNL